MSKSVKQTGELIRLVNENTKTKTEIEPSSRELASIAGNFTWRMNVFDASSNASGLPAISRQGYSVRDS